MTNIQPKTVSVPLVFDWLHFGQVIERERLDHSLTYYEIARLIDMSAAAVKDIVDAKYGNALMSTVLALANVFDLDVRVFFILSDTRLKHKMRAKIQPFKEKK